MTITDLKAIAQRVRTMRGRVEIGIPSGPTEAGGGSIATIAAAHVFGTARLPQRDFLRPAIENALPQLRKLNAANLPRVATGEMTMDAALGQLGAAGASAVQDEIVSGNFTPLKPATIKRKKSSKPLIASGAMRQTVSWRIARGGR